MRAKAKKLEKSNPASQAPKTEKAAIIGLLTSVTGILGLILFSSSLAIIFGLATGLFAVIYSIITLKRIRRDPTLKKGKAFAILGLFLGATLLIICGLGGLGYLL